MIQQLYSIQEIFRLIKRRACFLIECFLFSPKTNNFDIQHQDLWFKGCCLKKPPFWFFPIFASASSNISVNICLSIPNNTPLIMRGENKIFDDLIGISWDITKIKYWQGVLFYPTPFTYYKKRRIVILNKKTITINIYFNDDLEGQLEEQILRKFTNFIYRIWTKITHTMLHH